MIKEYLTPIQAARIAGITLQGVYVALKSKRLKAHKEVVGKKWYWIISKEDFKAYQDNKYSRDFMKDDKGDLISNPSEGSYSPKQLVKFLGVPTQHIYFMMRSKRLGYIRKGCHYVILLSHLQQFMKDEYRLKDLGDDLK